MYNNNNIQNTIVNLAAFIVMHCIRISPIIIMSYLYISDGSCEVVTDIRAGGWCGLAKDRRAGGWCGLA